MNLFATIDALPRHSQIALAANIIKRQRSTIHELCMASGIGDMVMRGALGIRLKPTANAQPSRPRHYHKIPKVKK